MEEQTGTDQEKTKTDRQYQPSDDAMDDATI